MNITVVRVKLNTWRGEIDTTITLGAISRLQLGGGVQ